MPKRIVSQLRQKGWKKPEGAVLVHRPFEFGNPFIVGRDCRTNEEAVQLYRDHVNRTPGLRERIRLKPKGKDVACRCGLDSPCHGDVLLEIANG